MSAPHGPVDHGSVYNGMPATGLTGVTWHKSRCSSPQGECVEVARLATGEIAVRNSRHPDGPALVYSQAEIDAFVQGVKNGDFDQFIDAHITQKRDVADGDALASHGNNLR